MLRSSDMKSTYGPSPHYVGLLETLQLAKELLLNVPKDVIILAVEAADCLTLGGKMNEAVRSAVGLVADLVAEIAQNWKPAEAQEGDIAGRSKTGHCDGVRPLGFGTDCGHLSPAKFSQPSLPLPRNERPCVWRFREKFSIRKTARAR